AAPRLRAGPLLARPAVASCRPHESLRAFPLHASAVVRARLADPPVDAHGPRVADPAGRRRCGRLAPPADPQQPPAGRVVSAGASVLRLAVPPGGILRRLRVLVVRIVTDVAVRFAACVLALAVARADPGDALA